MCALNLDGKEIKNWEKSVSVKEFVDKTVVKLADPSAFTPV